MTTIPRIGGSPAGSGRLRNRKLAIGDVGLWAIIGAQVTLTTGAVARWAGGGPSEELADMRSRLMCAWSIAALLTVSLAAPTAAATINGTNGPDVLNGTANADTIHGYAGSDRIYGHGGRDSLYAGRGADKVSGGARADRIYTGKDLKRDLVYGGPGPDRIYARAFDWVYAGSGNDTIRIVQMTFNMQTQIRCGPGYDTLIMPYGWSIGRPPGCERVIENP